MSNLIEPEDLAQQWGLKLQPNGKFVGPHPTDPSQGTKDGFILCAEGNAFTNGSETYSSPQVAEVAGISPDQYGPCVRFRESSGSTKTKDYRRNVPAPAPSAKPRADGETATKIEPKNDAGKFPWDTAEIYEYRDENGSLLIQVGRVGHGKNKIVRQRRPTGNGGFLYALGDVRRVLYRLRNVIEAQVILLVEGEQAAEKLTAALKEKNLLGKYAATTNPHGAGKWRSEYNEWLDGKVVCVLADNDKAGVEHAEAVCRSLYDRDRVTRLCRVDLPDLPPKGDVYDWLEAGGDVTELIALMDATRPWESAPPPAKTPYFDFQILDQLKLRPTPSFLIEGYLTCGGTSLLTAKHASFKSFIAIDMGLCVATGKFWHGHKVKAGKVVYVAAEGAAGLTKRAMGWEAYYSQPIGNNFVVL